jgi:hypothetical protein
MSRLFPSLEATRLAVLLLPRLALTPRVLPPLLVALMPVEAVLLTLLLLTLPPMLVLDLPKAELLLPAAAPQPVDLADLAATLAARTLALVDLAD